jgi:hypothetical protein
MKLVMRDNNFRIIFSHYGMMDGGNANGFTRSFNLAKGLVKQGNDVLFLTTQKKGFSLPYKYEYREGVKIYAFAEVFPKSFRKGGIGPLSTMLKILFVIFKRADIVHSDTGHRPTSGWPCLIHRFIYKSKYFSEWWEYFGKGGIYDEMPKWYRLTLGRLDRIFEARNKRTADGCLPISQSLKDRAINNGISEDKVLILNGGADVDKIPFVNNKYLKNDFGISTDTFVIGLIGLNDTEFINNLLLFKAVKDLILTGRKIKVIATGTVSKSLIELNKIEPFIKIYDWLSYEQFSRLIVVADLFTLIQDDTLRNRSRFPNKFGDYIAAGRPIIMNTIGDLTNYSNKYPFAFYIIKSEFDDVIDKLKEAYNDWMKGEVHYQLIRDIALENSWEKRSIELNNFYKQICCNSLKN